MFSKVFKGIFVPASPAVFLSATVISNNELNSTAVEEKKIRRTDLPIYPKEECEHCKKSPILLKEESNFVLDGISIVRKEIQNVFGQSGDIVNKVHHIIDTGVAHSSAQIQYIRDEDNLVPRIGAIAGASLFGLILATRKGFFKKLIYTTSGGLIMTSICYPKEAEIYSAEFIDESKKYALVGYHFLNGVSKDLIGYEFPELPKPISESDKKQTSSEKLPLKSILPAFSLPSPPLEVPKSEKSS